MAPGGAGSDQLDQLQVQFVSQCPVELLPVSVPVQNMTAAINKPSRTAIIKAAKGAAAQTNLFTATLQQQVKEAAPLAAHRFQVRVFGRAF